MAESCCILIHNYMGVKSIELSWIYLWVTIYRIVLQKRLVHSSTWNSLQRFCVDLFIPHIIVEVAFADKQTRYIGLFVVLNLLKGNTASCLWPHVFVFCPLTMFIGLSFCLGLEIVVQIVPASHQSGYADQMLLNLSSHQL